MKKYIIYQDSTNRNNENYKYSEMGYYNVGTIEANTPQEALSKYFEDNKISDEERYYNNGTSRFCTSSKEDEEGNFIIDYRDNNK